MKRYLLWGELCKKWRVVTASMVTTASKWDGTQASSSCIATHLAAIIQLPETINSYKRQLSCVIVCCTYMIFLAIFCYSEYFPRVDASIIQLTKTTNSYKRHIHDFSTRSCGVDAVSAKADKWFHICKRVGDFHNVCNMYWNIL